MHLSPLLYSSRAFSIDQPLHKKYPLLHTHIPQPPPIMVGAANSIITSLNQQTPSGKVPVFGHNLPSFSATFHPVIRVRGGGRGGWGQVLSALNDRRLHSIKPKHGRQSARAWQIIANSWCYFPLLIDKILLHINNRPCAIAYQNKR